MEGWQQLNRQRSLTRHGRQPPAAPGPSAPPPYRTPHPPARIQAEVTPEEPKASRCPSRASPGPCPPQAEGVKAEPFENHSALEIAEQLTLLDHLVFKKIPYE